MKTTLIAPGHSIENELSPEDMYTISRIFSHATPQFLRDSVGMINDTVRFTRIKRIVKMTQQANEELKIHGIKLNPLPLKESVLFIEAASLEENETLQALYTKILINANLDHSRTSIYISLVKQLTLEDVKVLDHFYNVIRESGNQYPELFEWGIISNVFSDDTEEAYLSFDNLFRLRLLEHPTVNETFNGIGDTQALKNLRPTKLGYNFIMACKEVRKEPKT